MGALSETLTPTILTSKERYDSSHKLKRNDNSPAIPSRKERYGNKSLSELRSQVTTSTNNKPALIQITKFSRLKSPINLPYFDVFINLNAAFQKITNSLIKL